MATDTALRDAQDAISRLLKGSGKVSKDTGEFIAKALEDPQKLEQYGRFAVGLVFAYIAWEQAPKIKANIFMLTSWLQGKQGGGGSPALSMQWYDWALLLTGVGAIYEAYRLHGYTGNVQSDAAKYDTEVKDYPAKVAAWEAARAAYYKGKQDALDYLHAHVGEMGITPEKVREAEAVIASELAAWDAEHPRPAQPHPPAWMDPTWEERALYAAVAFLLALHPEIIAELIKGMGSVLQGVGEIIPL